MAAADPRRRRLAERLRPTLGVRLALALLLLITVLAAVLQFVVAPSTAGALRTFGEATLQEGDAMMQALSERLTAQHRRVLIDLIVHTTEARERTLQDLPLETFGGDVAAIRATVLQEDAERSARQRRNVEVLAAEVQRRADAEIRQRLRVLREAQSERNDLLVADLRHTHLWLVAATLATLLAVLGLGLHRKVVLPTRRLQQATRRIAAGELDLALPTASRDELGELTRDFLAMAGQLRSSREAVAHLTANLEAEVQRQTRQLEEALRELAQAERFAALGTLAGGVAHEFHNVIGGIRGCAAELLQDEAAPDRRETLGVITRAADRAATIVQQLQRFARRPSADSQAIDPIRVLDDALRLCEPAARRQQVTIERDLPRGLGVRGDADGLHQVFVNLLVNALHAMPEGGTLRLGAEAIGERVAIRLADSGHGIPVDVLPRIFEPFFTTRADHGDPARRGSGLGLSVSYGIVKALGGSIEVSSVPGAGATFTVWLPRAGATPS